MRHTNRFAWLLMAVAAAAYPSSDESTPFTQIDRQFGSYRLGAAPAPPLGRLARDGETVCSEPVCAFDQGGYVNYYRNGSLVSKTFVFGPRTPNGPLGLTVGDDAADVISKIGAHVEGMAPVSVESKLHYALQCLPRLCTLGIRLGEYGIVDVELYYSDLR